MYHVTMWSVLGLFVLFGLSAGQPQHFHTIDSYHVVIDPYFYFGSANYMFFQVQACNDATIMFTNEFGFYGYPTYQFTIGGLENNATFIREQWDGTIPIESVVSTPGIVDCDYPMQFWANWEGGTISLGQGVVPTINTLISWTMEPGFVPVYVGLNTANGATGDWVIPTEYFLEVQTPSDYSYVSLGATANMDDFMVFQTSACENFLVGLTEGIGINPLGSMFEIAYGVGNNVTVIRTQAQGATQASASTPGILNCPDYTTLWAAWDGGANTVFAGTGETPYVNQVLNFTFTGLFPPRPTHISISGSPEAGPASTTVPRLRYNIPYDTQGEFLMTDAGFMAGETYVLFEVMACQNAHLDLGAVRQMGRTATDCFYDIAIGATDNQQTIFRRCCGQDCSVMTIVNTPGILACGSSLPFWASWDNTTSQVAFGTGWYPGEGLVTSYTDPSMVTVWYAGVGTLAMLEGAWYFPRAEDNLINTLPGWAPSLVDPAVLNHRGYFVFDVATQPTNHGITLSLETEVISPVMKDGYQIQITDDTTIISRWSQNAGTPVVTAPSTGVLDPSQKRKFWVSYANGNIVIGTGWILRANVLAEFTDPSPMAVNAVRVQSATDISHWRFPISACYRNADAPATGGTLCAVPPILN